MIKDLNNFFINEEDDEEEKKWKLNRDFKDASSRILKNLDMIKSTVENVGPTNPQSVIDLDEAFNEWFSGYLKKKLSKLVSDIKEHQNRNSKK